MMTRRAAEARGHANHGWLDSFHTFSFADYYDPAHMGFRGLRVINEDRVAPHTGFGTHAHRDMEIVTYVLSGRIEHKDSLGTHGALLPGDVQRMSAGTGVRHSEMNPGDEPLHFLQLWMLPKEEGIKPAYEQKTFAPAEREGRFRLVVSPHGEDGSISINADVKIYATLLTDGQKADVALGNNRHAWLQVARGKGTFNGLEVKAGDGVSVSGESRLVLTAKEPVEALLFDLA
jgi:redox-sensitive bicupin YhaK (pirin superfamily)